MKAYAAVLNGIAILPLGSLFELYGKAGVSKWKVEAELNSQNIGSNDDIDPVYSLGFGYHIDYDSTIRLEYEISDYDDTTFSVISFGFQHNF
ncbi:outer membrane beta-barrel protein [Kaarinaea lacus]